MFFILKWVGSHQKGRENSFFFFFLLPWAFRSLGIASEGPWGRSFLSCSGPPWEKTGPWRLCGSWWAARLREQEAFLCKTVPVVLSGAQPPELPHAEDICTDNWAESCGHSLVRHARGRQVRSFSSCWHQVTLGQPSQCVGKRFTRPAYTCQLGLYMCWGRNHQVLRA